MEPCVLPLQGSEVRGPGGDTPRAFLANDGPAATMPTFQPVAPLPLGSFLAKIRSLFFFFPNGTSYSSNPPLEEDLPFPFVLNIFEEEHAQAALTYKHAEARYQASLLTAASLASCLARESMWNEHTGIMEGGRGHREPQIAANTSNQNMPSDTFGC